MERCNEMNVCSDDVLLCYNNLIEVNCENVEKVTVNYLIAFKFYWFKFNDIVLKL